MLRMITNRSPSSKLKPLPRAAQARLSPPLMEGIANKQEPLPARRLRGFPLPLWRGVNGIANNELITVSQTIVGRWPPCHVLQQSKWVISGRMGHGDHHPTLICIPNNEANHSRTGSPCPVLQQEARVFTPLSNGEGLGVGLLGVGLLYIYAILRAFSETHQITV